MPDSIGRKLGLIVNPVAGLGGRVGLKGSDGPEILLKALELGAVPEAPTRAAVAMTRLAPAAGRIEVLTWAGDMGENPATAAGLQSVVLGASAGPATRPEDTVEAAQRISAAGADLLLFAGGDGTARDIHRAVGDQSPVLGIPAGVKIHSAVYANNPRDAGDLALRFLTDRRRTRLKEVEVMDIDEEAFRENRVSAKLYGYLWAPYEKSLIQSAKAGSAEVEEAVLYAIASDVISNLDDRHVYFIGSGTTTRAIMDLLGLPNTLLGIDAVYRGNIVGRDLSENGLLKLLDQYPGRIVITVIGGQGHVFGRGNQQFSPKVIRRVGRDNIIITATMSKILGLRGKPIVVDTGDPALDQELSGYAKVVVGLGKRLAYRIAS